LIDLVALNTYSKHLSDTKEQIGNVQFSDQYALDIEMLAPIKKVGVPRELIKGFTVNSAGLSLEETQAGGRGIIHFSDKAPDDITITLYNKLNLAYADAPIFRDAIGRIKHLQDIADEVSSKALIVGGAFGLLEVTEPISGFLNELSGYGDTAVSSISDVSNTYSQIKSFLSFGGGSSNPFSGFSGLSLEIFTAWYFFKIGHKDIVPMDGTLLLPEDWKFEISAYSLDGSWHENKIAFGEYVIDGNTQISYTSDGGALQEFELTFKRLT